MSYQWGSLGPAFEFPTCYRIENRFLTLRGSALLLFALALVWVAVAGAEPELIPAEQVDIREPGSPVPYLVAACLFALLGIFNIALAARQRRLMFTPGEPASLAYEVQREAIGAAAGAVWLLQAVNRGAAAPLETSGAWRHLLPRMALDAAAAPRPLHAYMQLRFSHVLLAAGLLVLLGVGWLANSKPTAHTLVSLLVAILSGAVVARGVLDREKDAPGPIFLAIVLGVGLVAGTVLSFFSHAVPQVARATQLDLPLAAAVLLVALLLIEALGLLAARTHVGSPAANKTTVIEQGLDAAADPGRLFQEIGAEMHRRWTEGIPNRRYIWQPPVADATTEGNAGGPGFTATLFEESQPLLGTAPREDDAAAHRSRLRLTWLLGLGALGLLLTLAGGVLWVQLASAHMQDVAASWTGAALGAVLIAAGGHALRVGHLLWSRFEVDSVLTWIELTGAAAALRGGADADRRSEPMTLRVRVARARSVFYAAAEHRMGSRTLLGLEDDPVAARMWAQQVHGIAQRMARTAGQAASTRRAPEAPATARNAAPAAPAAAGPRVARFCTACGTSLLAGARFCQHCGHAVPPG